MSLRQTINYDMAGNFTFDSSKIEIVGGAARLKLIDDPGQGFSEDFASNAGFAFSDAGKVEVASGVLRQINQRPGATFGARFDASVNASFGDGSTIASATGGPTISSGKLDLTGGGKYVNFDGLNNVSQLAMLGCIKFRFTPDYNGAPSANQIFLKIDDPDNPGKNTIELFHATNGSFFVLFNDQDGANQLSNSVAPYNAVSGEEVEVELSWDLENEIVRFFGDGFLVAEIPAAFVRSATATVFQFGDSDADFLVRDVIVFDSVQHTANFSAFEYTVPPATYAAASAALPSFSYSGPGALAAVTGFDADETGSPRYTLQGKYWNGSAWVTSAGTYAEASPLATVAAQIASLPAADALSVVAYFDDGNSQGSVDNLLIDYTGQIYPTTDPAIINNSGVGLDGLDGFGANLIASGSDDVRFLLRLDGTNKWWNGSAWVTSDGSLAESNAAAEIEANKDDLDVADGATLQITALLHSADGSTTPSLASATIDYNFFAPTPADPDECIVYGHLRDVLGDAVAEGTKLVIVNHAPLIHGAYVIAAGKTSVIPDEDGRIEVSLVETESISEHYEFLIEYLAGTRKVRQSLGRAVIPDQASINLTELAFIQ